MALPEAVLIQLPTVVLGVWLQTHPEVGTHSVSPLSVLWSACRSHLQLQVLPCQLLCSAEMGPAPAFSLWSSQVSGSERCCLGHTPNSAPLLVLGYKAVCGQPKGTRPGLTLTGSPGD